jgi:hypothetical protein
MGADLTIRQGDTYPPALWVVNDPASPGNPLDLTGASVTFVMRALTASAPTVNAAGTIENPNAGLVAYVWADGDTDTPGIYSAEWHVTLPSGKTLTSPSDGYYTVAVDENLTTVGGATIVSLGDAKEYLNIPATSHAHDRALIEMIVDSTGVIEDICGPVLQRSVTEWPRGGTPYISLKAKPVISVESVTEWLGAVEYDLALVDDPADGTPYSVQCQPEIGLLVRRTAGGGTQPFPDGPQSVKVVFTAGRLSVPGSIRRGNLELLRFWWDETQEQHGHGGAPGQSSGDDYPSRSILGFAVPGKVREMLAPERRAAGVW